MSDTETPRLSEREWTDKFGTHFQVEGKRADGRICGVKVTRHPHLGWCGLQEEARRLVFAKMERPDV